MNQYDNPDFFEEYAEMPRRLYGLGCGYGWYCKFAANRGSKAEK